MGVATLGFFSMPNGQAQPLSRPGLQRLRSLVGSSGFQRFWCAVAVQLGFIKMTPASATEKNISSSHMAVEKVDQPLENH